MTSISRHQFNLLKNQISSDFVYGSRNFWQGCLFCLKESFIGTTKFCVPIYSLQAIYEYHKHKTVDLKTQLEYLGRTVILGTLGWTGSTSLFYIFTKYGWLNYYSTYVIFLLSGIAVCVEINRNLRINSLVVFVQVIETVLQFLTSKNVIERTPLKDTVRFMVSTGVLMYMLKIRKKKRSFLNIWFYHPLKKKQDPDSQKSCFHKEGCLTYIAKGTSRFFCIAYAIEVLKRTLSKVKSIYKPKVLFEILLSKENVKFGLFVGGYVGIYRAVVCLLNNYFEKENDTYDLVAGFLAGVSYWIKPNLTATAGALATIFQLLYFNIMDQDSVRKIFEDTTFPFLKVTYMGMLSYLVHIFVQHNGSTPRYVKNMIDLVSNGQATELVQRYYKIFSAL